eukprot:CAMPEP_0185572400 /NCGR_PEP_ID=MMETSP0434-20130131/4341_1 /TAXON_ID=626734 ORGANISM="Favella taraikaensis, Strain Fe Narragansett Bay" /NCGR_SAMPLE_ID=MMETSP0434 /ASSEMBLY_ACC=CAM_ASM_000379 /LENGTH=66 /DNA_ID=CAMNT_0028188265 /DNA_START=169 /DNA_END=369 /DNA_ORIENTATION=-
MGLDVVDYLASFNADKLDVTIAASDGDLLASLVEFDDVGDGVASVQIGHLLDHPDVPNFDDTVRIT